MTKSNNQRTHTEKVAFAFARSAGLGADVLGNKGLGLVEMVELGMRVPEGYTVGTMVARAYAQHSKVPNRLRWHLKNEMRQVEKQSGKVFGDRANPLLVSVRSSAAVSMPGMMDTVLNVGINMGIVEAFVAVGEARFAYDCYRRFLAGFGEVVLGMDRAVFSLVEGVVAEMEVGELRALCLQYREYIEEHSGRAVPEDVWEQLEMAVEGVLRSWNSERAVDYRRVKGIDNALGTAVALQRMAFGNRDERSCTGVAFSRNVVDGSVGLWGEFKRRAQGEEIVSGVTTPEAIEGLTEWDPVVYGELAEAVELLERRRGRPVEVEFTVESGVLYFLQVRDAVLTAKAAVLQAVHAVWAGRWSKAEALASVTHAQVMDVRGPSLDQAALLAVCGDKLIARGKPASPGVVSGTVVRSSEAAVSAAAEGKRVILVAYDTTPHDLPGMLAASGIVTMTGGATSHPAVVARGLGKPAVVGCGSFSVEDGELITIDGEGGVVMRGDVPTLYNGCRKEVELFIKWYTEAETARWRAPAVNFEHLEERVSCASLVSDFYLCDAMYNAALRTDMHGVCAERRRVVHQEVAERLALYLMVAVAGELRHTPRQPGMGCVAEMLELTGVYGVLFGRSIHYRGDAQQAVLDHLRWKNHEQQKRFFELADIVFSDTCWNGCVGGEKWARIARAGFKFLNGEYSHSVFADHTFDLQHNGGSVFGKHPMISAKNVYLLLNIKKTAQTVGELYGRTAQISAPGGVIDAVKVPHKEVSDEVEGLYRRGVREGVWAPPSVSVMEAAVAATMDIFTGSSNMGFKFKKEDLVKKAVHPDVLKGFYFDQSGSMSTDLKKAYDAQAKFEPPPVKHNKYVLFVDEVDSLMDPPVFSKSDLLKELFYKEPIPKFEIGYGPKGNLVVVENAT